MENIPNNDHKKEYFLSGNKKELMELLESLTVLKGFFYSQQLWRNDGKVQSDIDFELRSFYEMAYKTISTIQTSLSPNFIQLKNLDLTVEHSRKEMGNDIISELTKNQSPEETIKNIHKILNNYEIIGRYTGNDDDIPF